MPTRCVNIPKFRNFKISLVLLLLLTLPAIPAPAPGVIWPEGTYMTSIPLKRAGRLCMVEATIDGVTGNMIFDTGATGLILNSTYFRNAWTVRGTEAGGVAGSAGAVRKTVVKKLQIAGLLYPNVGAEVTDLGHIENRRGVKVLGLFGSGMLRDMEVVIDVAGNRVSLYRLDRTGKRIGPAAGTFRADLTTRIQVVQDVMFVRATIGAKELNFCLDTGAESNILSSSMPGKVMNTVTITRRADLQGVGGGRNDMLFGLLGDFSIGTKKISGMQTLISSLDDMSAFYEFQVDGMLGYDFFEQGIVSLNLVTRQMGIMFRKGGKP